MELKDRILKDVKEAKIEIFHKNGKTKRYSAFSKLQIDILKVMFNKRFENA